MWWLLLHLDALGIRCYVHTVTQITGPRSWYAPRPHGDVISSSSQHNTARDWQQLISIIHMQSRCTCPGHMTCLIFGDNCLAPPNISNISSGRRAILQECWWWLAHDRISDVSNRSPLLTIGRSSLRTTSVCYLQSITVVFYVKYRQMLDTIYIMYHDVIGMLLFTTFMSSLRLASSLILLASSLRHDECYISFYESTHQS